MDMVTVLSLLGQAASSAGKPAGGGNSLMPMIFMFLILFLLFQFLILRPQSKEKKRRQELLDSMQKGDKVITIGGIHGKLTAVDTTNNTVSVQVDSNVIIHFSREAIATVITKDKDSKDGKQ